MRDLHERLGHLSYDVMKVMLNHSTSPDIRATSRDFDNAERWLGPCTPCLKDKMIGKAGAVGDMVCLDLIEGDELSFVSQPYAPNKLKLKRRVEATLPSDEVVDMLKEQPYWKGSMVRRST